jgi:hypothetical protein
MIKLEHNPEELTTRCIDILAPVGFRPARPDRRAAAIGQNDPASEHRQGNSRELSQRAAGAAAGR